MPLCLLAPLPSEHVAGALAAHDKVGVVALGTGDLEKENGGVYMFDFFRGIEKMGLMGNLPVFIQVSLSGQKAPAQYFEGNKATLTGILLSYDEADASGRHKKPDERPASALKTDGRLSAFWRIRDLRLLGPHEHVLLGAFKIAQKIGQSYKSGKKIDFTLRGPILAFSP